MFSRSEAEPSPPSQPLFRRLFGARRPSRGLLIQRILALAGDSSDRLARLERSLARVQRDVERIKLHSHVVLEPQRAVALLATGDRIYVDPRDHGCGINMISEGRYEDNEIRVLRRYLKPGILMLDVGANYGYYSS